MTWVFAAVLLATAPQALCAIQFTSLFSFNGTNGAVPEGTLIQAADGKLYGATLSGGTNGVPYGSDGTIFRISTNGEFRTVAFLARAFASNVQAPLFEAMDGNLYGTAAFGGPQDFGALFSITPGGLFSVFTFFFWPQLEYPNGLVQSPDGTFYSTGYYGGTNGGFGSIVSITTNGTVGIVASFGQTNGAHPQAALVRDAQGNFYGTTVDGGTEGGWGTVFQLTPDGLLLTLAAFNGTNGAEPLSKLWLESDGTLYGTTFAGGTGFNGTPYSGNGTIFKITPARQLVTLHYFAGFPNDAAQSSFSGLCRGLDAKFYGTSEAGGLNGGGTIFVMDANGSVSILYSFSRLDSVTGTNLDGYSPSAGLIQASDGSFYGVTMNGGLHGLGSIFRFRLSPDPPRLKEIHDLGSTLSISWTAAEGAKYQLQYSKDLFMTNWLNLGSSITATGSLAMASDVINSDPRRFYRVVLLP